MKQEVTYSLKIDSETGEVKKVEPYSMTQYYSEDCVNWVCETGDEGDLSIVEKFLDMEETIDFTNSAIKKMELLLDE